MPYTQAQIRLLHAGNPAVAASHGTNQGNATGMAKDGMQKVSDAIVKRKYAKKGYGIPTFLGDVS